jgi:hypothetical protein
MSNEELAFYLKDITNLEPHVLPSVLKSKEKEDEVDEMECPIKVKKNKPRKIKLSLDEIAKEFD